MEKNIFLKKLTVFIVITLFIAASFIPSISGNSIEYGEKLSIKSQKHMNVQEDVLVTCYTFGMPGEPSKEIEIPPTAILQEKLYGFLDKKIGIFNNNGDYKFRIIQDRKSKKIMQENRCRKLYNTTVQSTI